MQTPSKALFEAGSWVFWEPVTGKLLTSFESLTALLGRALIPYVIHPAVHPSHINMTSKLSQKGYGGCLTKFKERLGLRGQEDLVILANVSMSPFISHSNFEQVLADTFRKVAEEEVEV
ncbi:hypothetical protein F5888DRAFT_1910291 [Russula emetica]|nr:hypothetical protein F5888DRAFT_1910291 [Russula emetica]